jgi:DNA-binding response OmpR family regulator
MKVLIIDDEPLVRRSLARALKVAGHEVIEAEDGPVGLDLWLNEIPNLVFIDVLMPGMTGPEVIQSIPLDKKSQTKIIMMSAFTGKEGNHPVITEGVDLFLTKPFEDIFKIVKMAEEVFSNGRK